MFLGSQNQWFSETPPHRVLISDGFLLGKHPVTRRQWQAVMGYNPSTFSDSPDNPVDTINWDQANEFCDRLSETCGHRVRLPSEAEWEYACRANTRTDFFFGPWGPFMDESKIFAEIREILCGFAWFDMNSGHRTHATQQLGFLRHDWQCLGVVC